MQDPDHNNVTSDFATALAASPWLREYAADSAERAASDAAWDVFTPAWDAHLRLYPRKLRGWARVERAAALASAYWELIGHAAAGVEEGREKRRRGKRSNGQIRMLVTHPPTIGVVARRHAAPVLRLEDEDAQAEVARKEKLRLLFGQDFPGAAEDRESTAGPDGPASASGDDDPLAGRRVLKQQSTSDVEQLLDVGARFDGLRTLVDGVRKGGVVGYTKIVPGCICVARRDVPSSYIVCDQAYEVVEIYYQGLRGAEIERVPVPSLDARPPEGCAGYTMYLKLYSQEYHTEPVTVRPEEVGIVSLGEEVLDSLKIGVPILGFWLAVISFLLAYGEATM